MEIEEGKEENICLLLFLSGKIRPGEEARLLLIAPVDISRDFWKAAQLHPIVSEVEASLSLHLPHVVHIHLAFVSHQVGGWLPRWEVIEISEEVSPAWRRSAGGNAIPFSLIGLRYSRSSS